MNFVGNRKIPREIRSRHPIITAARRPNGPSPAAGDPSPRLARPPRGLSPALPSLGSPPPLDSSRSRRCEHSPRRPGLNSPSPPPFCPSRPGAGGLIRCSRPGGPPSGCCRHRRGRSRRTRNAGRWARGRWGWRCVVELPRPKTGGFQRGRFRDVTYVGDRHGDREKGVGCQHTSAARRAASSRSSLL